jgi:hypothetical protein
MHASKVAATDPKEIRRRILPPLLAQDPLGGSLASEPN